MICWDWKRFEKSYNSKKFNEVGSIGLNLEDDETISLIYPYLSRKSLNSDVQIVVIGGIDLYKEYYPITFLKDSAEFVISTLKMITNTIEK